MKSLLAGMRPGRAAILLGLMIAGSAPSIPVLAQDNLLEMRIRNMEAQIRAVQTQDFSRWGQQVLRARNNALGRGSQRYTRHHDAGYRPADADGCC